MALADDGSWEMGYLGDRLLIWLNKGDLNFTQISKKFSNYDGDQLTKARVIELLIQEGYAKLSTDKDTLSRFSKRGRPRRTLSITQKGSKYVVNSCNKLTGEENED